jgi:regulatory protein
MQKHDSPFVDTVHETAIRRAMDSALRILSRRDHTCRELALKLRRKGFGRVPVDHVIARCRDLGYLDDARTAGILAGHLAAKGYGPLRIRQVLGQKGLDDVLVGRAVAACIDDISQADQARRMLDKRRYHLNREPDPVKRRHKAFRYLAGRGFSADIIRGVIDDAG